MSQFWDLANINVYKILCPPKLRDYYKEKGRLYSKEDVIYFEKNKDNNIYLVSKGKVKLVNYDEDGNEIIRQIITKGGLFGENLLLVESERTEYAVACNNSTAVCSTNLQSMRELMRNNEKFSTAIYKFIGLKYKRIERRLDLLVGKDVQARIAGYIYDLYKEEGTLLFSNQLTQKEMASLLATTRESISRVLNKLKKEAIVKISQKTIEIQNLESLKKLAE